MSINYKGEWGYHPLVVTLANTRELLYLWNRPGNRPSHERAYIFFDGSIDLCRRAGFRKILMKTGSSRTTFIYDLTGNQQIEIPAAGNRTTTTWNYENQPSLYKLPSGGRVTMLYNGDNRRVEKQEP